VNAIQPANPANALRDQKALDQEKIRKSSQEFEGLLLSALWKSMGEDMKDSLGDDSAGSSFLDMGLQAVSAGMAQAGGVGIGRMLLKALEKQQVAEGDHAHADQVHGPK
jgi:Rod binding domain-containing protein